MFGFSTDCKKDVKINIMLNALMENNTNNAEEVVAFFHCNFGIWCTADKRSDYYSLAIHISGDKETEHVVVNGVYYITKESALIAGIKIILAYIYYLCAFIPNDSYKIVDNNSFYVKAIKCIKCAANSIDVRMKDRFDNYHLTKIDCDFPALVESLNL
jgi:hypothetical protein|nr:MAG TPA: hypothetical protein [Crassvirales sp.]